MTPDCKFGTLAVNTVGSIPTRRSNTSQPVTFWPIQQILRQVFGVLVKNLVHASLIQLAEIARLERVQCEFESHERYLRQTKAVQEGIRNPVLMVFTYGNVLIT